MEKDYSKTSCRYNLFGVQNNRLIIETTDICNMLYISIIYHAILNSSGIKTLNIIFSLPVKKTYNVLVLRDF